jgi:hypothetical protein
MSSRQKEVEVLAALASAFHRKALVAVKLDAPRGKTALPEYGNVFSFIRR